MIENDRKCTLRWNWSLPSFLRSSTPAATIAVDTTVKNQNPSHLKFNCPPWSGRRTNSFHKFFSRRCVYLATWSLFFFFPWLKALGWIKVWEPSTMTSHMPRFTTKSWSLSNCSELTDQRWLLFRPGRVSPCRWRLPPSRMPGSPWRRVSFHISHQIHVAHVVSLYCKTLYNYYIIADLHSVFVICNHDQCVYIHIMACVHYIMLHVCSFSLTSWYKWISFFNCPKPLFLQGCSKHFEIWLLM